MNKTVKTVLAALGGFAVGIVSGIISVERSMEKEVKCRQTMSDKHLALFLMMNQWVKVKQDGKNLADYFVKAGYKRIAVYGMSYVGETLLDELKDTEVSVAYGIDKNADSIFADIDVVSPDDDLKEIDAVVVTSITFFDEIEEMLEKKINCPIISLEDILYEV